MNTTTLREHTEDSDVHIAKVEPLDILTTELRATLKEEIAIPIDDSQRAKNAEVEGLDLSTSQTLKAKVKKASSNLNQNNRNIHRDLKVMKMDVQELLLERPFFYQIYAEECMGFICIVFLLIR